MGYIPPPRPEAPFRLNLDRFGLPKDYETYVWLLYKQRVKLAPSPERLAFLHGQDTETFPTLGVQEIMR